MTDKIFEFYILDPASDAIRKTNYSVSSPKGWHRIFRGTVEDFQKVEELYGELWASVIDNQLGLIEEHAGELTDDPILQNWEGAEIIVIDFITKLGFWYLGDGNLEPITNRNFYQRLFFDQD